MDPQERISRIERVASQLDNEPLFHMSLGSKELFHSNFLGWLFLRFPDLMTGAFGDLLDDAADRTELCVRREKRHLDLIVELPGKQPLVIENKMFALPDNNQLRRYTATVRKEVGDDAALTLLSLTPPDWTDALQVDGLEWRFLGYDSVRTRLLKLIGDVKARDAYIGETLKHYCAFIGSLLEFSAGVSVESNDEPLELSAAVKEILEPLRLHDVSQKIRAHKILLMLRGSLGVEEESDERIVLASNFTNKQSILEFFYPIPPARPTSEISNDFIGWQLQGGQWRLAMVLESLAGRTPADRKNREDFAGAHREWFDFRPCESVGGIKARPDDQRPFNRFDPSFIYQYERVGSITVDQIIELGLTYIRRGREFSDSLRT